MPERLLVIDEIQKIDNWSEIVKAEWDRDTKNGLNLKVVLLGSSRLMLMRGLTESLAGRFELIRLGHWSYKEMKDCFGWTLDEYIYYGGYPGAASLIDAPGRWRSYVKDSLIGTTISKDVLMTGSIYKPALLRQLFELGCAYSAKEISLTKVLGQLQDRGNVTTFQNYLNILGECHLLTGLQKFAGDNARKYNSIPKFQVYNNALRDAYNLEELNDCKIDASLWERLAESSVGAHLMDNADEEGYKVYYWRHNSFEVDYVLQKGNKIVAIEVKSGLRAENEGLALFSDMFHPNLSLIVGPSGIPLEEFLSASPGALF